MLYHFPAIIELGSLKTFRKEDNDIFILHHQDFEPR